MSLTLCIVNALSEAELDDSLTFLRDCSEGGDPALMALHVEYISASKRLRQKEARSKTGWTAFWVMASLFVCAGSVILAIYAGSVEDAASDQRMTAERDTAALAKCSGAAQAMFMIARSDTALTAGLFEKSVMLIASAYNSLEDLLTLGVPVGFRLQRSPENQPASLEVSMAFIEDLTDFKALRTIGQLLLSPSAVSLSTHFLTAAEKMQLDSRGIIETSTYHFRLSYQLSFVSRPLATNSTMVLWTT